MNRWRLTDAGEALLLEHALAKKKLPGEFRLPGDAVRIRVTEIRRRRGWLRRLGRRADTVTLEFFVLADGIEIATFPTEQIRLGTLETLTIEPINVTVPMSITRTP
jgi:hypothetical protein